MFSALYPNVEVGLDCKSRSIIVPTPINKSNLKSLIFKFVQLTLSILYRYSGAIIIVEKTNNYDTINSISLFHRGYKMKNKKKIILIIILAIIYIAITINFHKIKFTLSILKLYNQKEVAESPVEKYENTENPMDDYLKEISSSVSKDNNHDTADNINKDTDNNINLTENTNLNADKNKIETDVTNDEAIDNKDANNKLYIEDTQKPLLDIVVAFNKELEFLQSTFEGELEALVEQGIKEYSKKEISNKRLASKYLTLGSDLEKICDTKFNNILKEMETELKSNDHPTTIVKDIRKYYNNFKNTKKADLINRGKKHL